MRTTDSNKDNQWSLFGFDLTQAGAFWSTGWQELRQTRLLNWLEPKRRVWLTLPDGTYRLYDRNQIRQATPKLPLSRKQSVAVVVPATLVLEKTLTLPRLSTAEIEQMLELDMAANSPFGPSRTVWGWSQRINDRDTITVTVALADRDELLAYRRDHELEHPNHQIELWHLANHDQPVVFQGFGETQRLSQERRHRLMNYVLVLLAVGFLLGASIVPVFNNYILLQSARAELVEIQQKADKAAEARNNWLSGVEQVEQLKTRMASHPNPSMELEIVSEILPDNTYLERLELRPQGVRLTGYSQNATAVVDQLGDYPYITAVNVPTGISRDTRTGLDNFTLHFAFED